MLYIMTSVIYLFLVILVTVIMITALLVTYKKGNAVGPQMS